MRIKEKSLIRIIIIIIVHVTGTGLENGLKIITITVYLEMISNEMRWVLHDFIALHHPFPLFVQMKWIEIEIFSPFSIRNKLKKDEKREGG